MGTTRNQGLRKPGGAGALAAEHARNAPRGASLEGVRLTLSPSQACHSKKVAAGARVGSA